jgi:hypothetical protein
MKKNSLSLKIGPPKVPPKMLRVKDDFGVMVAVCLLPQVLAFRFQSER